MDNNNSEYEHKQCKWGSRCRNRREGFPCNFGHDDEREEIFFMCCINGENSENIDLCKHIRCNHYLKNNCRFFHLSEEKQEMDEEIEREIERREKIYQLYCPYKFNCTEFIKTGSCEKEHTEQQKIDLLFKREQYLNTHEKRSNHGRRTKNRRR